MIKGKQLSLLGVTFECNVSGEFLFLPQIFLVVRLSSLSYAVKYATEIRFTKERKWKYCTSFLGNFTLFSGNMSPENLETNNTLPANDFKLMFLMNGQNKI